MGEIAHDTILKAGDSYTTTLNVRIPDGISGNFYVLVFSDANVRGAIDDFNLGPDGSGPMGRVQEFQGEGNNITAATLAVILRAAPKLQVAAVAAQGPDPAQPGHVFTGQSFTVTYTVANNGPGDTPDTQSAWDDQIWLSRDQLLTDADIYLDRLHHTGGLKSGASYTNTDMIKQPRGLTGPWYVFVVTDPLNASLP